MDEHDTGDEKTLHRLQTRAALYAAPDTLVCPPVLHRDALACPPGYLRLFAESTVPGGSFARGTEDELGSLAAGRRADLVVLDADPTDERTDLGAVGVRSTVIAGEGRYRSERPVRPPG